MNSDFLLQQTFKKVQNFEFSYRLKLYLKILLDFFLPFSVIYCFSEAYFSLYSSMKILKSQLAKNL